MINKCNIVVRNDHIPISTFPADLEVCYYQGCMGLCVCPSIILAVAHPSCHQSASPWQLPPQPLFILVISEKCDSYRAQLPCCRPCNFLQGLSLWDDIGVGLDPLWDCDAIAVTGGGLSEVLIQASLYLDHIWQTTKQ